MRGLIYLDNAATTMSKPPEVRTAVFKWTECGNPGRGSHSAALAASEKIYEARAAAAALFGGSAENTIFTSNATSALNIAIKGLVPGGSHIITSDFEHNSVRRPVLNLCKNNGCSRSMFVSERKEYIPRALERLFRRDTAAVVCLHRSNITGRTMPIREIGRLCRERGILFIVDASQSAGNAKIDMEDDNIDVLCTAGHKGLYGPQGTGLLILREARSIKTLLEGGSGTDSRAEDMPEHFPDRLEAGTLSTMAVAGLLEGIKFVSRVGEENIHRREAALWKRCCDNLRDSRITVYDRDKPGANLLFNIKGASAAEVSTALDKKGICTRPGLHCAPDAHTSLSTVDFGAVRASFSYFTTEREADIFSREVLNIAGKM